MKWILLLSISVLPVMGLSATKMSEKQIAIVLDDFHNAASHADEKRYFGHFHKDGVFIGTDIGEYWSTAEFRRYVSPHFSKDKGWTYVPAARQIMLAPGAKTAWFHETLKNSSYGDCRGTGVLVLESGQWKIMQYHLTIPIPNEVASDVVALIRAKSKPKNEK